MCSLSLRPSVPRVSNHHEGGTDAAKDNVVPPEIESLEHRPHCVFQDGAALCKMGARRTWLLEWSRSQVGLAPVCRKLIFFAGPSKPSPSARGQRPYRRTPGDPQVHPAEVRHPAWRPAWRTLAQALAKPGLRVTVGDAERDKTSHPLLPGAAKTRIAVHHMLRGPAQHHPRTVIAKYCQASTRKRSLHASGAPPSGVEKILIERRGENLRGGTQRSIISKRVTDVRARLSHSKVLLITAWKHNGAAVGLSTPDAKPAQFWGAIANRRWAWAKSWKPGSCEELNFTATNQFRVYGQGLWS